MSQITIAGGGFAGVWAALAASATRDRRGADDVEIRLVSKEPNLCIRPRLYEGARPEMLVPLQSLLEKVGVTFESGEITSLTEADVGTSDGRTIAHDRLIFALGSRVAKPGIPMAAASCFAVDDYAETARLDRHFAELDDKATVVVVGASFSGLEIATELRKRLGAGTRIALVDQASAAGQSLGKSLTGHVATALDRNGVTFIGGETIVEVAPKAILLASGRRIETRTVIFATGLRPSSLGCDLGSAEPDGRLTVDSSLRVPERPKVFAAGDVAAAAADASHKTLMSCQHAMPMGVIAGQNAVLDLIGDDLISYAQPDYATCLSLGDEAVFTQGWGRKIAMTGAEGAAMKTQVNEIWIYPPSADLEREEIFEAILPTAG